MLDSEYSVIKSDIIKSFDCIDKRQGCGNTMPDLSGQVPYHPGQAENFYLLVLGRVQCIKLIQFCISYFDYYELTSCIENSVDPDQLASSEAS